eukprot:12817104-Alexandrium_andersonii.AAC.1
MIQSFSSALPSAWVFSAVRKHVLCLRSIETQLDAGVCEVIGPLGARSAIADLAKQCLPRGTSRPKPGRQVASAFCRAELQSVILALQSRSPEPETNVR